MNIKELGTNELKVLFYDELERLELARNNVSVISQELAQRAQANTAGAMLKATDVTANNIKATTDFLGG